MHAFNSTGSDVITYTATDRPDLESNETMSADDGFLVNFEMEYDLSPSVDLLYFLDHAVLERNISLKLFAHMWKACLRMIDTSSRASSGGTITHLFTVGLLCT